MQVIWRNFRLTFEATTPEEHETLMAVWVAFGSQVDDRSRFPYQSISNGVESFIDPDVIAEQSNQQTISLSEMRS